MRGGECVGKFKAHEWETLQEKGGNISAKVYDLMLTSAAYKDLTPQAKALYTYMKAQLYATPREDKPNKDINLFVFNRSLYMTKYELYSNGEHFSKYCHELIAHGFIEIHECGRTTRTKNVYKYSDKWKNWTKGTDYRPLDMKYKDEQLKTKRDLQRNKKK
jgi:hypothetical protein